MTEEEVVNRLAACKDIVELIEGNIQKGGTLPLEGATDDQLDRLEQFEEVDPGLYSNYKVKRKAKLKSGQLDLLREQFPFLEQRRILKNLMRSKE